MSLDALVDIEDGHPVTCEEFEESRSISSDHRATP